MSKRTEKQISSLDGVSLYVQQWQPDTPPRGVIAVIHGWSDHGGRYGNLVDALLPQGYAVHALDLRGHGHAAGQRGHIFHWREYRGDVMAFLNTVQAEHPDSPLFLFGHSLGGLIVMDYVIHHPDAPLSGIILSAPLLAEPNVPRGLVLLGKLLSRVWPTFSLSPGADPKTLSRDEGVVQRYIDDPLVHSLATPRFSTEMARTQASVLANLDAIQMPLLLIYGAADALVPPDVTRKMFNNLGATDKTQHEYPGGYHELLNDLDREVVTADILAWLSNRK